FAVAGTWWIARTLGHRGVPVARSLLLAQCLLIAGVLLTSVIGRDNASQGSAVQGIAAMLAVSAMACQFAMLHVALPGVPSTAVMTGNLTQIVLSVLDVASARQSNNGARVQLAAAGRSFVGFFVGCTTGTLAVIWLERWAWSLPVAMAVLAALTA